MSEHQREVINIQIAGLWSCEELSAFLSQCSYLYEIAKFAQQPYDREAAPTLGGRWHLRQHGGQLASTFRDPEFELQEEYHRRRSLVEALLRETLQEKAGRLEVGRIHYASPGFVDLVGFGRAAKEVRQFLLGVIDRYIHRRDRDLSRAIATQDLIAKKIANAERLLKLSEKMGLDHDIRHDLIREVLAIDYEVEGKILMRKITGIGQ